MIIFTFYKESQVRHLTWTLQVVFILRSEHAHKQQNQIDMAFSVLVRQTRTRQLTLASLHRTAGVHVRISLLATAPV